MANRVGYALLWLSAIPAAVLRFHTGAAQIWRRSVLPHLRAFLAALCSTSAFPVCDLIFFGLILLVLICLLIKKRRPLPFVAAALVFSLSITWTAPCTLSEAAPTASAEQLHALCQRLSADAAFYQSQNRDFDRTDIRRYAARLCRSDIVPKSAAFPSLMADLGLAGWWSPLTSEAVVDMTMGELNLPFALCHELMHARGVASESQAHYLAYLACMQGNGAFRYSGAMNALWYGMRALRRADEDAWYQIIGSMDAAVLADFRRMNGFSEAPSGPLSRLQDAVTDLYLHLTGADDYDGFAAWLVYGA